MNTKKKKQHKCSSEVRVDAQVGRVLVNILENIAGGWPKVTKQVPLMLWDELDAIQLSFVYRKASSPSACLGHVAL